MILYHVIETRTGKVCILETETEIDLTLIVNGKRDNTITLSEYDIRRVAATLQEILGHIHTNKDSTHD